jgi:hypothetical protein
MQKKYTGFEWDGWHGEVILEWSYPQSRQGDVRIINDDFYRSLRWIDGDMTTRDRLDFWYCKRCNSKTRGHDMVCNEIRRVAKPYSSDLNSDERQYRLLWDEEEGVIS